MDEIYYGLMTPGDTFVMSKGHAAIAQYVVLESLGLLPSAEVDAYCTKRGRLGVHPDRGGCIAASTGALGHGLAMAAGMAYANREHQVYCLLSDGECQEGSTWEAAMVAANLRLSNLVCFVDNNDMNSSEVLSERHPALYPLEEKFRAFGWNTPNYPGPTVSVIETVKSKGVSFMEGVAMWHYRSPTREEFSKAMAELA